MNFTKGQFVRAYNTLYTGTGPLFYNEGLAIDHLEYPDGYTLYSVKLSTSVQILPTTRNLSYCVPVAWDYNLNSQSNSQIQSLW